jgi:hypothetical protein
MKVPFYLVEVMEKLKCRAVVWTETRNYLRVEVLTAVTMKNAVFWANVPSSLILSTLMVEAIRASETLVVTRATPRHFPEDDILHINYFIT